MAWSLQRLVLSPDSSGAHHDMTGGLEHVTGVMCLSPCIPTDVEMWTPYFVAWNGFSGQPETLKICVSGDSCFYWL